MSQLRDVGDLANLTTVYPEDHTGIKRPMLGCVSFGPVSCVGSDTNAFLFGVDIDRHFREAGWKLVTKNAATGVMSAPIGMPDQHRVRNLYSGLWDYPNDAPLFVMSWTGDNSGDLLQGYNSYLTTPPHLRYPWEIGTPTWIPEGEDGPGTWRGITEALHGTVVRDGSGGEGCYSIFPVGDYSGTLANDRTFAISGFLMTAGNAQGAGKTFESRTFVNDDGAAMKIRAHLGLGLITGNYDGNLGVVITVLHAPPSGSFAVVGAPIALTFNGQPDYLFFIDPYSLCIRSRYMAYHPDLYGTMSLYASVVNSAPAMPRHSNLRAIPPTACVTGGEALIQIDLKWFYGDAAFDGTSEASGEIGPANESGMAFEVMRSGPAPVYNNDGSDVCDSARMLFSTDYAGPGGLLGPTYYLGQAWNSIVVQREYGPTLQAYWLDAPDPKPLDELAYPIEYRVAFHQSGGEENFVFDGTQGSVLRAVVDYARVREFDVVSNPDDAPLGAKCVEEYNLFAKETLTEPSHSHFIAIGGQAIDPDHSDGNARYQGPQYAWTISGLPAGWGHGPIDQPSLEITGFCEVGMIGVHSLVISVVDTFGHSFTLEYDLVIGTSSYPQITTPSGALAPATVGASYSAILLALGGSGTFVGWTISSGDLPPGLSLDPTLGSIYGVPSLEGVYSFNVVAQDSLTGEVTLSQTYSIVVS